MERRKFLIGAGSLAAGSAAAMGTGAFTTVEAERDVAVNVTDDANAYLSIRPAGDPNGVHADQADNGEVFIDIADSGNDGDGVNPNAVTTFDDVLMLRNKGTQDVGVWVEKSGDLEGCTLLFYPSNRGGPETIEGRDNARNLPVGGGPTKIGIKVDTTKTDADEISGTITFHADADEPSDT